MTITVLSVRRIPIVRETLTAKSVCQIHVPVVIARARHAQLLGQVGATLAMMESIWMKVRVLILGKITTITVKVVTARVARVMEEETMTVWPALLKSI